MIFKRQKERERKIKIDRFEINDASEAHDILKPLSRPQILSNFEVKQGKACKRCQNSTFPC